MVYVILATGFEEIEALCAVDVLRRAGAEVATVGLSDADVRGAHGITVVCDTVLDEVADNVPDMLVLPGGMPGVTNLDACPAIGDLTEATLVGGGYVGAICAAPMVLGRRGYLRGRRAMCFPGFEKYLDGAKIVHGDVVRDGQIVTSRSMGTALPFALELVACLFGRERSIEVGASIAADASPDPTE